MAKSIPGAPLTISTINGQPVIRIPKWIRERYNWVCGEVVYIDYDAREDSIKISRPKERQVVGVPERVRQEATK